MSVVTLVVAVDKAWGIGKDNHLLCHLPADLRHFKQVTMGKPIVMGRKTFESIGRPLPGRRNVVLTHQKLSITGVDCVASFEEALSLLHDAPEIMVIGGGSIYHQILPRASKVYLTQIQHVFEADTFFPALSKAQWQYHLLGEQQADDKQAYSALFYLCSRNGAT